MRIPLGEENDLSNNPSFYHTSHPLPITGLQKLLVEFSGKPGYNVRMSGPKHFSRGIHTAALLLLSMLAAVSSCSRKTVSEREVWAEVDGKPVYREQVERYYHSRVAAGSDAGNPEQALSFKLNILNELINNQILVDHAARSKITASEAEVDTKVAEFQSPYTPEEFRKKLADQGLDPASLRDEVRQNLIVTKLITKEIVSRVAVSDREIAEYFARNRATFNVPETLYHLAQIAVTPVAEPQVRNTKNDDAKNPQVAERKITALYARLRSGEDFATVAQEYSEDVRTASGGGDMGFIPASTLASNPPLRQAITSLKVGDITGILRTPDGYHILKLMGREEAGQRELSNPQVAGAIRQTLMNEREQLLKSAYLENLRNRAKVRNYLAEKIVATNANAVEVK
jgi:peptidyl-prolyl cis-trans isomerase SurA